MTLDRKSLRDGDRVCVAHAGCDHSGPYAHVYAGVVVAAGGDGSFVYRTDAGRVDTVQPWSVCSITATEAEAWEIAATRLAKLAESLTRLAAECRAKGSIVTVQA